MLSGCGLNRLVQSEEDEWVPKPKPTASKAAPSDKGSKPVPKKLHDQFNKAGDKVMQENLKLKAELKRCKAEMSRQHSRKRKAADSGEEQDDSDGPASHKPQDKDADSKKSTQQATPHGQGYYPGGPHHAWPSQSQYHTPQQQWQWQHETNQTMQELMNEEQVQHQVKVKLRAAKEAMVEAAEEEERHRKRIAAFKSMMNPPATPHQATPPSHKSSN
jgi:hypothetical protein